MFYTKKKIKTEKSVLDYINTDIKLKMNWNMIKNGASVNEVFKKNPTGLEAFLKPEKKYISANSTRATQSVNSLSFKKFI